MRISKSVVSVWPSYVAAVSSLVLSLLLLAGVLVVAISQVGRLVDGYNDELMVNVIEDERRAIEVESLRAKGRAQTLADKERAAQAAEPPKKAEFDQSGMEAQLRKRTEDIQGLKQELGKVQDELRQRASERQQRDAARLYRFVLGPGVQGLDQAVIEQFSTRVRADGVSSPARSWTLEAGVAGLDPVASREVYRLMLNIRAQLAAAGISADQISISMNKDLAPQALPGGRSPLRPGEVPMLLKSQDPQGGGR